MKTINNKKKGAAALIIAAILTLVMLFAGCKHKTESKKSEPKYTITFGVDGTNGTLKAMVGGNEINTGDKVAQGKTVTFTATPNLGYKVKEWKVGNDVITGNTSNTYTCTVTKAVTVKVSFLAGEASYKVKHYQEKAEGGYPAEPTETEDKSGAVGTNAVYTPKTGGAYEGFTYKSELTKINGSLQTSSTINGDGSTVVELFYERNTVNVIFNLAGGNVAGNTGPIVKTGKYGTAFTAPADPVKTDDIFERWNPSLPSPLLYPASNAEYTAQWQSEPKYTVTFGVEGTNGTLKAKADGVDETSTSPINIEEGKTVTFTATAAEGYEVDTWTVTPISALQSGTGTTGSATATITVSAATEVKVTFKKLAYSITFGVEGTNGTLKAEVDGNEIHSGDKVKHGKFVTFTATPSSGYKVKEWKVGNDIVAGNTSNTYTCTVIKAVHVTVSFAPPDVGSFEDAGDFVKIIPPANGIAGVDPDYTLPIGGGADRWKGVFIKDRKVKLSPYKLGKTEVTYKVWHEVLTWAKSNGYTFANKGREGSDGTVGAAPTAEGKKEPVTTISWRDCIVWCNAYTAKTMGEGECVYRKKDDHNAVLKDATATADCDKAYADMGKKGFRLPTEAEWEYAARWQGSDKTNAAQYGDVWLTKLNSASGAKDKWDTAETGAVAWYSGNSDDKTHPVGKGRANALGLHDMSGNVWEWCFDWYGDIEANTVTDPQGGASGPGRVKRGGSWDDLANVCAVGKRDYGSPRNRSSSLGFRLACLP